jgi:hypothetical protein
VREQPQLGELPGGISKHFQTQYSLTEDAFYRLESKLRDIAHMQDNLDRMEAVNAAEAKAEQETKKKAHKRDRSPAADAREREAEPMDDQEVPTEVAPSENGDDDKGARQDAADDGGVAAPTPVDSTAPVPPAGVTPAAAGVTESASAAPAAAPAGLVPGAVLGPLGTAPYGAQAARADLAATPLPRVDRERSPRREPDPPPPVAAPAEPDAARAAAVQDALERGDYVQDSLDSLPVVEAAPAPSIPTTASNARGGGSLT